jgi:hypothetical protein
MPLILVNLTYSCTSNCFWYVGTYQSRKCMCASEAVEVTLQQSCKYRSSILYGLVGWEIEEVFWLKIFGETLFFDFGCKLSWLEDCIHIRPWDSFLWLYLGQEANIEEDVKGWEVIESGWISHLVFFFFNPADEAVYPWDCYYFIM